MVLECISVVDFSMLIFQPPGWFFVVKTQKPLPHQESKEPGAPHPALTKEEKKRSFLLLI